MTAEGPVRVGLRLAGFGTDAAAHHGNHFLFP